METTKARGIHPGWIAPALLAVAAAVAWPLALPWTYDTHDGHYALYNAAQLDHALRAGEIPVRWLPDLFGGRGIPLFLYYHPMAFYLVALVHLAGPGFILSMKVVEIVAAAAAGWAMLRFLSEHVPAEAAAVGAAAYVAAPIHVLELHVKGDPPAVLAYALAPLLLLAIGRAARGTRFGIVGLALASAALVLSHSVTTLLLFPTAALYAALTLPAFGWKGASRIGAGCALGATIASFHWGPALTERGLVHIDSVRGILAFDWRDHFVAAWQWLSPLWGYHGSFAGTRDDMSFQIGPAHLAGILLGGIALRREGDRDGRRIGLWAACTVAIALAMTLSWTAPAWERIGPLRYVQFPWRFLMPAALGASALAALAAARLAPRALLGACALTPPLLTGAFALATGNRFYAALLAFQLALGAAAWLLGRAGGRAPLAVALLFGGLALPWSAVPLHARFKGEPAIVPIGEADLRPERVRLGVRRTTARDDYLPRTVGVATIPPRDPSQEYLPPASAVPPEDVLVRDGRVDVRRVERGGRGIRFEADAPDGGIVTVNVHDFPGWEVFLRDSARGGRQELVPGRDDAGRIVLALPPGRFDVRVRWTETPSRRRWDLAAALGIIVTLGMTLRRRRRGR